MTAKVINLHRWTNKRDRALFNLKEMENEGIEALLLDVKNDLEDAKTDPNATDKEIRALYLEHVALSKTLNKRFVSKLEKYF